MGTNCSNDWHGCWATEEYRRRERDEVMVVIMSKFARWTAGLAGLVLASLAQTAGAGAASLSGVQGEVLVDAGQGPKPVTGAANLGVGNTVIAQNGSAKLTYPDGCAVNIDPGASVTIGEKSPCAAQAGIQTGQVAPAAVGAAGLSTAALVVGGVVVAGAVGVAVSQKKGNKHSVSP